MAGIEVLLFDIGGVLVEFDGVATMGRWANLSRIALWEQWIASPAVRDFESGRILPEQFSEGVVDEFNLPVSPDRFLKEFGSWAQKKYPGIDELLTELSQDYMIACFSNTNEIHWPVIRDQLGLGKYFDRVFVSHRMGLLKPDPDAFDYVIEAIGRAADKIAFFDDNQVNVTAGIQSGMPSYLVDGDVGLHSTLREIGYLG